VAEYDGTAAQLRDALRLAAVKRRKMEALIAQYKQSPPGEAGGQGGTGGTSRVHVNAAGADRSYIMSCHIISYHIMPYHATDVLTYDHSYIHKYKHIHIHTYMYIYTYMHNVQRKVIET
jgi:hypothetical protein